MIEKLNYPHVGILIVAWFAADLAIPLLMMAARRLGALDRPHDYKTHAEPVPFLGGFGIFLAVTVAILSVLRFTSFTEIRPLFGIILGASSFLALGAIDDYRSISAVVKLAALLAATGVLYGYGIQLSVFPPGLWILNLALTLLWIAGITSAMNSLDNTDGVAGGTAALAAAAIFAIAWRNYALVDDPEWRETQKLVSYFSAAILGGCLGFLRYNFAPARVYLGNNGSFLLGFVLAALTVVGGWSVADPLRSMLVPCAILAVPLFDITLATLLRWREGTVKTLVDAIVHCGRDHMAHRLMALGLSVRGAALVIYLFGAISAGVGIYISDPRVPRTSYLGVTAVSLTGVAAVGVVLSRARLPGARVPDPVETANRKGC